MTKNHGNRRSVSTQFRTQKSPDLRCEQNLRIMYSSEDLERFYFQYQTETFSHGESLQSFCVRNKVSYNIFQKWYKDTRKKIVPVQVDGISGTGESSGLSVNSENPVSVSTPSIRIWIDLRAVNDLHLFPKNFLHYGSDAGAEMAAIHHRVISTVKFHGSFVWDFIGIFLKRNL